jgi:cyclophilin family peptidyl-prolyl cis-trans isomerase
MYTCPHHQLYPSNIFVDITEDGGVKKRLITYSEEESVTDNHQIGIKYTKSIGEKTLENTKKEPFRFTLGNNEVLKGVEIGVKTMKLNEKAEFIISSEYSKGDTLYPGVSYGSAFLTYEIEVVEINPPEKKIDDMNNDEKLNMAKKYKEEGIKKYNEKDFEWAIEKFEYSLKYLNDIEYDEFLEGKKLVISLLTNISNCYNSLKNYIKVLETTNKGLLIEQTPKLFYFRALACVYTNNYKEAEKNYNNLKKLVPEEDNGVLFVKEIIEKKISNRRNHESKFLRNYFRRKYYDNDMNFNYSIKTIPSEIMNKNNPIVLMKIIINNNIKYIEIELFKDKLPITCENFLKFCMKKQLNNIIINKVIKDFILEFNPDINNVNKTYFKDENFDYSHCTKGLLTMGNENKSNTNHSKFWITLSNKSIWLDGKNTVFGHIIKNLEILDEINECDTNENDVPIKDIIIENCCVKNTN